MRFTIADRQRVMREVRKLPFVNKASVRMGPVAIEFSITGVSFPQGPPQGLSPREISAAAWRA